MPCARPDCPHPTSGNSKYCAEHREEAHKKWVEKIRSKDQERKARTEKFEVLYQQAHVAGQAAALACTPTPMVVQQHANMADDASPVVKQWHVPEGVCGFAWVVVTPGNSSFALWLKKNHKAHKHYYGGVAVWVHDYNQSMELKFAYAQGFAKVLQDAGLRAHAGSRMD